MITPSREELIAKLYERRLAFGMFLARTQIAQALEHKPSDTRHLGTDADTHQFLIHWLVLVVPALDQRSKKLVPERVELPG